MIRHYIRIALRNMARQKTYALINVLGLAIGIAAVILIMLFVVDEMSYDRFHENGDRIVRLVRTNSALSAAPIGPALAQESPEVRSVVRIDPVGRTIVRDPLTARAFYQDHIAFADAGFFRMFSFKLVRGNPDVVLREPNTMVITESIARQYFGGANPVGKVLEGEGLKFTITGVMEDAPHNSHYHPGMLVSFKTLESLSSRLQNWKTNWLYTYLMLDEGNSRAKVESELPSFFENHVGDAWKHFRLQPLLDIHLRSKLAWEIEPQGSIVYVYIFSAIAFLLVVIACINFMNLATARSIPRGKEVGLRKVLGANRKQLVEQFIGESLLTAFLAFLAALVLVALTLPAFNNLTSKSLHLDVSDAGIAIALLAITLFVGLFAGSYPALLLSRFTPIAIIKNQIRMSSGRSGSRTMRRGLVIVQFAVSVFLIIGTVVIYEQLAFIRSKDLGFSKDQIVVIPFEGDKSEYPLIKEELKKDPSIMRVSASGNIPGVGPSDFYYRPEGFTQALENLPVWDTYFVDDDFINTFGMRIVQGRGFEKNHREDSTAFILNETAVHDLVGQSGADWSDPVGKRLDFYIPGKKGWTVYKSGPIVGVVKDFNYLSLHEPIGPLVLQVLPGSYSYLLAKISTQHVSETLSFIKNKVTAFVPDKPFEYSFLDDRFDSLYRSDQRLGEVFGIFAFLAIFVACMGLFGLTAFTVDRRAKEIGIRKVLGASVTDVVGVLSGEFVRLVLVAEAVSMPIAYYVMTRWLQNFVYRIDVSLAVLAISGAFALAIALAAVIIQTLRAASANPVEALRYE